MHGSTKAPRNQTHKNPETDSMNNLSAYPITRKWPAQHPERIQL
jgi:hypothetical protein